MVKGKQFPVDVPETINLGAYFLDVNLELGRADRPAIYFQDQTLSFLDLWRLTNRCGNVLKELGVEPENRILLILEDSPEWAAAWLAAWKLGAIGTHAYTYLNPHDYEYLIDLIRPKVVVTDATTLERVRAAARGRAYPKALLVAGDGVHDLGPGEFGLAEMLAAADDGALDIQPTHRDDLAFWNFSGGTTGKPKGVPHMNRDAVLSYSSFNSYLGYTPDDIILRVPKLFFHYARDNGLMFGIKSGAANVLFNQRTTAEVIFDLIAKHRPTVILNVPTMMRAMLRTPVAERADLSCVRRNYTSGEVLSPALHDEWIDAFGGEVIDRIGSAETGMAYLTNHPGAVLPGSSGTVTALTEIKLVDDAGADVPQGQPGTLMVRTDASAFYYERAHEKSVTTFPGDKWVNTGDLFTQDENDYFWFVGRANDMIKVSGVWVSPLEIELGLQENDQVRECAALALENEDGLLAIKAFVVLEDGEAATEATSDALKRFCKEKLAPHKYPTTITFMEELPKTGQGKMDRLALREG